MKTGPIFEAKVFYAFRVFKIFLSILQRVLNINLGARKRANTDVYYSWECQVLDKPLM